MSAAAKPSTLGLLFYQGAQALALPLALPWLLASKGWAHYRETWDGRWHGRAAPPTERPLWLHAVSVGEVNVATTLARALPAQWPLLLTTVTPTGQALARRFAAGRARSSVAYLPFDFGRPVKNFFDLHRPRLLILNEGDYWPRLLHEAATRKVPVAVINGRLSDRAFARQRRIGGLNKFFYGSVARFGVQTALDAQRLEALGVPADKISVTGNLKFDSPMPAPIPALEALIRAAAAGRPIVVAGSTMAGEEQIWLELLSRLGDPKPLLVLAPRHPERFAAVAELVVGAGLALARRSAESFGESPDVFLLDSLGELAAIYRVADLAFVGGTLVPKGGHNPIEPAKFGVPIVVGPSQFNFKEIAATFDDSQAWLRVKDSGELGAAVTSWLARPEEAAGFGRRAAALLAANRGALAATLDMLRPLFAQVDLDERP